MNIVICCDGTRGKYGQQKNNTNVVRLFERLGSDGPDQSSYYDPGVGTYSPFRGAGMAILDKLAASISGVGITSEGIDKNTEEAYRYLMDGYTPGAKILSFRLQPGCSHSSGIGRHDSQVWSTHQGKLQSHSVYDGYLSTKAQRRNSCRIQARILS